MFKSNTTIDFPFSHPCFKNDSLVVLGKCMYAGISIYPLLSPAKQQNRLELVCSAFMSIALKPMFKTDQTTLQLQAAVN